MLESESVLDNKKIQEREEVHKAIWNVADELRGSVDGWDFKIYILGTMFYRYISENLREYINQKEEDPNFDYAKISDEEAEFGRASTVLERGFFIKPSELFENVRARAREDENLNETLKNIFRNIEGSSIGEKSEGSFRGLFDDFDVNSNKLGSTVQKRNEKLIKLLDGIAEMNLGNYKENDIDAFGDAYEFLMSMYASNAGKSGGEYFTPQDVSELLAKIAINGRKTVNKVYDMCCGSGSLLLKVAKVLADNEGNEKYKYSDAVEKGYFGQEINITTYNLCRINMYLHDVPYDKFDIKCEDTLINPMHRDDEPFDVIVSNPPYSIKWVGDDNPLLIQDDRFAPVGVLAPKSKADLQFIVHAVSSLSEDGVAAIVCFPGVMYRGGAEQKTRQYLIERNYVDTIIQLPSNLFFGTSIATCIMVLKKSKKDTNVLFIDASKEFEKDTNNNRLSKENIDKIMDVYTSREDVEHFSKNVSCEEIREEKYNISVSTYVEPEDTREKIDITKLNQEIREIVSKQEVLRKEIEKIILEIEGK